MPTALISISAPLYPTESADKVKSAILKIFPDAELEVKKERITGNASDLERFREILRGLRIRDTARHYLIGHLKDGVMEFSISKQAAYVGKISFGGNNPALGEIDVKIESESPEKLIQWLTFIGD